VKSFIANGLHQKPVRNSGLELVSADRLASALGLVAIRGPVARAGDSPPLADPSLPYLEGLRAATLATGHSVYALSRLSRLSQPPIARFLKGERNLTTTSIAKLASAVGFDPRPTEPAPVAPKQCPIVLKGQGFPILVYGVEIPRLTGIAYALTEFAVERFLQGGVCAGSELAERTTSTATNPIKSLTLKLKEPEFQPLARVLIWDGKRGGSLRIIDPGPIG
jgi:hypothetical protein